MTASEWYREFIDRYREDQHIKKLCKTGAYEEGPPWTKAMLDLLRRMGKDLGCEVSGEKPVAGGGRSDQRWVKDNASVVYIEHENICDGKIQGEIGKLCNDVSKLKVLITYVGDPNFDRNVRQLIKKIEDSIRDCRGTFTGEFLLVVSGYDDHDWESHISVLRMEPLQIKGAQL